MNYVSNHNATVGIGKILKVVLHSCLCSFHIHQEVNVETKFA